MSTSIQRTIRAAGELALAGALVLVPLPARAADAPAPKPKAAQKAKPPSNEELRKLLEEQQKLIAEQQEKLAEQQEALKAQEASIAEQKKKLDEMQAQFEALNRRLGELQNEIPDSTEQQALAERLERVEKAAKETPELPPNVVSAGDFPGSIRIPGTDAAIKFGGRIRAAAVFTLDPLGTSDRFLTNSIPVESTDEAAGETRRTTFSANTSRLNFEMRTPTGAGQMRAFLEGDFYGVSSGDKRANFRLRHAYAQFKGVIVGQTWSTFSDPAVNHQDLDFEGINAENVIRQPQIRYTWNLRKDLSIAAAAETPEVSLTGGQGVNLVPDLIGRAIWTIRKTGHIQTALVLRQIRGQSDAAPSEVKSAFAWGASVSGVLPFQFFDLTDRFIWQINGGKGNARYINDLQSLGGQDAVFDPITGELYALSALGWYVDYEHEWKFSKAARDWKLRSSLIWSFVGVDNLDFQLPGAYKRTNRLSLNLVFSPIQRIDVGVEYIYGTRENKDGNQGSASQFQTVGIFRF